MTDDEIRQLWVYAAQTWPTFTLSVRPETRTITLKVWRDHLGNLDVREVQAAMVALDEAQHLPPFGVIRSTVAELRERRAGGSPAPDVDEAWREVRNQISMTGRIGSPLWSHPAVEAAVAAMGWQELCNSTDPGIVRGQFAKMYASAARRLTRERVPVAPALAEYLATQPGLRRADEVIELEEHHAED